MKPRWQHKSQSFKTALSFMVTYENVFVFLICKKLICRVQPSFIDSFNAFTVQEWIEICEMLAEKTKLFLLAAYLTQRDLLIWKHLLRFWTLFLHASCITSYLPVQHLLGQLTKTTESVRWLCCKKKKPHDFQCRKFTIFSFWKQQRLWKIGE